jgi:hypothetical protein
MTLPGESQPRRDPPEKREAPGRWPLLIERIILLALGVDNAREAWLEWDRHPALGLISALVAAAIVLILILTWPAKQQ